MGGAGVVVTSAGNWAQRRSQRKTALRFMKRRRLAWTRSTIRVSIATARPAAAAAARRGCGRRRRREGERARKRGRALV
jgi:hypothetical protein